MLEAIFGSFIPVFIFLGQALVLLLGLVLGLMLLGLIWFLRRPWRFEKKKFHDPQRILIFGRPGKGKTTLGVFEAVERLRAGEVVISNIGLKWFGFLSLLMPIHIRLNSFISRFFSLGYFTKKLEKEELAIEKELRGLEIKKRDCIRQDGSFRFDLTLIHKRIYELNQIKHGLGLFRSRIETGFFKEIYYPAENYIFEEDLGKAIYLVVKLQKNNPDTKISIIFDEGFSYLNAGMKPPKYITNFINQSRKLNCSVIVISQRPVAVYPDFRALVDFMVLVDKGWFGKFTSKKYFVDTSADALPNLDQIESSKGLFGKSETIDVGENYKSYSGKDVFPYFDTRQSFALNEVLKEFEDSDRL